MHMTCAPESGPHAVVAAGHSSVLLLTPPHSSQACMRGRAAAASTCQPFERRTHVLTRQKPWCYRTSYWTVCLTHIPTPPSCTAHTCLARELVLPPEKLALLTLDAPVDLGCLRIEVVAMMGPNSLDTTKLRFDIPPWWSTPWRRLEVRSGGTSRGASAPKGASAPQGRKHPPRSQAPPQAMQD